MPEEGINPAAAPDLLWDVWQAFCTMAGTRTMGMAPSSINEQEIAAYCANRRLRMNAFCIDIIHALDRLALASDQEAKEQDEH